MPPVKSSSASLEGYGFSGSGNITENPGTLSVELGSSGNFFCLLRGSVPRAVDKFGRQGLLREPSLDKG